MHKLAAQLFETEAERMEFVTALTEGEWKEQGLIVVHDSPVINSFPLYRPLPWQPNFVRRLSDAGDFKPAKHPLYAKGAYYSLDFSSAFAASAMMAIPRAPRRILDLCSSPGGKAVFAWRAFLKDAESAVDGPRLFCNEIMRKRVGTLVENLIRCKITDSAVTPLDPSVWSHYGRGKFDLVIVDAPCSGQSLYAKGSFTEGAFDPKNMVLCISRQRRIVGHALDCIRPGGYLLYMTCTFNKEENEKVINWITRKFEGVKAVEVPGLEAYRSRFTEEPCYRLYPQSGLGAGAFTCLLKTPGGPEDDIIPPDLPKMNFDPMWIYGEDWPMPVRTRKMPVLEKVEPEEPLDDLMKEVLGEDEST